MQSVYLWGAAGAVTDTRRAKRLFPLFAAGEILGSVVGGLLTGPLAATIGARNLLLVWAACLVGACLLVLPGLGVRPRARVAGGGDPSALAFRDMPRACRSFAVPRCWCG